MVGKETARDRLDRIEALLPTMLVEIEALRLLLGLLIDLDFDRYVETDVEPLMFLIQSALEDRLEDLDPETDDIAEQIQLGAVASAMVIADRGESVDIDLDEPAANDD